MSVENFANDWIEACGYGLEGINLKEIQEGMQTYEDGTDKKIDGTAEEVKNWIDDYFLSFDSEEIYF